jgi:hypothetical protein
VPEGAAAPEAAAPEAAATPEAATPEAAAALEEAATLEETAALEDATPATRTDEATAEEEALGVGVGAAHRGAAALIFPTVQFEASSVYFSKRVKCLSTSSPPAQIGSPLEQ